MSSKPIVYTIDPNEYKNLPEFTIIYGTAETPHGKCLMGLHNDRTCYMSFYEGDNPDLSQLQAAFPKAALKLDNESISRIATEAFGDDPQQKLKVVLKGTEFQTNVWKQLLNVPKGSTATYEQIAVALGKPKAIRAVAQAIARNKVAYLIPCHRIVRKKGSISKYRWGADRKLSMLKQEGAI